MRLFCAVFVTVCIGATSSAETLRHPESLETQLKATPLSQLAAEARKRGSAKRGALLFYKSAAACVKCHVADGTESHLGPDLATVGSDERGNPITEEHLIESLLYPSRTIRHGYEAIDVVTADGVLIRGMFVREDEKSLVLRDLVDLSKTVALDKKDIESRNQSEQSMMPDGLVAVFADQREFYDQVKYVIEVARGGRERSLELKPTDAELAVTDDSLDLDHAGIIAGLATADFAAGKRIYQGYCYNCHGNDGNTPSLPTARAFGKQKLKFGASHYEMFMTLTKGNGLMAAMSHLSPKERYQVVHYVREGFMKDSNPDYKPVTTEVLKTLPKGSKDGTIQIDVERDYGPALASQLERQYTSVLNVKLGGITVAYDLNTMDQARIWAGGFLDLSQTQHVRDRGEGTANPQGTAIEALAGWSWGHEGTLDYPTEGRSKRTPLPSKWMQYQGHYLHGNKVVLNYQIDGRDVLEMPAGAEDGRSIDHVMSIGPGKELLLCVANIGVQPKFFQQSPSDETKATLLGAYARGEKQNGIVATAFGEIDDLTWIPDPKGKRLLLRIAASEVKRTFTLRLGADGVERRIREAARSATKTKPQWELERLLAGGPKRWPETLSTTGYLGLERGGYALDTISIPESTPWNTWFRTSAVDFFSDGRMAIATYGGDVWIVSGVDDELLNLEWKRFAGGLYEPFGLKIVDDQVFVTCKDRITRLHDRNGDGEADFYESFSADPDVSVNFHAFNFDLQTDRDGNFYYAKSGHGGDSFLPGYVVKISSDGKRRSILCTGFRTPNGMGALPDGRVTVSDNQGQWTPAGKINLAKQGGFYGWVNNYAKPSMWWPGEGTVVLEDVEIPKSFDPPLVWLPQELDNSSGGQLFVDDKRWGPISGRLLHTSFGKGWMYYAMIQELGDGAQAAIVKLPFNFRTGIMRARVNPKDGQVYATGLQGWNGGGRAGLLGQGIQRLRYTGKPNPMVTDCQVLPDGLLLSFNFLLDRSSALARSSYQGTQWNYKWAKTYGSDQYRPSTGEKGVDRLSIESVELMPDERSVKLKVVDLQPVNQLRMVVRVKTRDGKAFEEEVYWTINHVPQS